MRKLVPILAITALSRVLTSAARTINGSIPRSTRTTPRRPALAGASVLIAILAAVLFTGRPALAQGDSIDLPQVTVSFFSDSFTAVEGETITIGVELSAEPEREVVIPITVTNRGGASSADYSGVPSSVTIDSDEDYTSFRFTAAEDSDDDGESVQLGFGPLLPAGVRAGSAVNVWITDHGEVGVGLA